MTADVGDGRLGQTPGVQLLLLTHLGGVGRQAGKRRPCAASAGRLLRACRCACLLCTGCWPPPPACVCAVERVQLEPHGAGIVVCVCGGGEHASTSCGHHPRACQGGSGTSAAAAAAAAACARARGHSADSPQTHKPTTYPAQQPGRVLNCRVCGGKALSRISTTETTTAHGWRTFDSLTARLSVLQRQKRSQRCRSSLCLLSSLRQQLALAFVNDLLHSAGTGAAANPRTSPVPSV